MNLSTSEPGNGMFLAKKIMIYNDGYIIVSCLYFIWNPVTGLAGASEVMLKLGK